MILDKGNDKAGRVIILTHSEFGAKPYRTQILSEETGAHYDCKSYTEEIQAWSCFANRVGGFSVTYEIVTQESAEHGDAESRGYIGAGMTLQDAIAAAQETRTSRVGGVECVEPSDSDIGAARWFTVQNGMEFETGAQESRSLHIPEHVTAASRKRIARLMGTC